MLKPWLGALKIESESRRLGELGIKRIKTDFAQAEKQQKP
jgi:hypothetical protein